MFSQKRKSISPLIATILLVVVAVAIIGIVLSWGKGFANTSLSSASTIDIYTESEVGFYLNIQNSINGRSTISYNPPDGTPYNTLNIIGYGLLGYTENIVPLEPPITLLKNKSVNIDHGIILPEIDLVLYLDNERMITKQNIKQTIKQPSSCPEGYTPVPGNHLYGTMNERGGFCVMKWEAKTDANSEVQNICRYSASYYQWSNSKIVTSYDCNISSYNIVSTSENFPIGNISLYDLNLYDARDACFDAGGHLITNDEWMTIARNIELVPENWSDGEIGSGYLPRGNSNSIVINNSYIYDGTDPGEGINKRTLKLTNGQDVWDMAGNLYDWVDFIITLNDLPLGYYDQNNSLCSDFPEPYFMSWFDYSSGGVTSLHLNYNSLGNLKYKDLYLLNSNLNSNNKIGSFVRFLSPDTNLEKEISFFRGGTWTHTDYAGINNIWAHEIPSYKSYGRGFRCVK